MIREKEFDDMVQTASREWVKAVKTGRKMKTVHRMKIGSETIDVKKLADELFILFMRNPD
jgi:hypothetical protein